MMVEFDMWEWDGGDEPYCYARIAIDPNSIIMIKSVGGFYAVPKDGIKIQYQRGAVSGEFHTRGDFSQVMEKIQAAMK